MPVLNNPKHERFAQFLAQGETAVDAYEQVGYKRDDGNAVRLAKKPAITDRVQELTGLAAARAKVTVESLIAEAEEVLKDAKESKQYSAAIGAIREMGVLSGVRVERKEVGQPGEFDHLSDDELLAMIREGLARLGLTPVERFSHNEKTSCPDAGSDRRH